MYSPVLIFTLTSIIICSARSLHNDEFFQIGHKRYYITPTKTNFFAARNLCIQNNVDLATFESTSDLEAVSDYLTNIQKQFNAGEKFWTSYFDLGRATGMYYSIATGRPLTASGWVKNEPNNWQNKEHCLQIKNEDGKYGFNDVECMTNYRALCEEKPQWDTQPHTSVLLPINGTATISIILSK